MSTELAFRQSPRNVLTPQLVVLDESFCDQLCAAEKRCYSHPWSAELIRGEFKKDISLRLGLVIDGGMPTRQATPGIVSGSFSGAGSPAPEADDDRILLAYSFNYLVADELHVLNLAVHPDFRSRGYGKRLLSEVIEYAVNKGARFATLEVRQSNYVAKSLYSEMGFEIVGVRKNYYRDNFENALVLELNLTSRTLRIRS